MKTVWMAFGRHFYGHNPFDADHWFIGWKIVTAEEAAEWRVNDRGLVQLFDFPKEA